MLNKYILRNGKGQFIMSLEMQDWEAVQQNQRYQKMKSLNRWIKA